MKKTFLKPSFLTLIFTTFLFASPLRAAFKVENRVFVNGTETSLSSSAQPYHVEIFFDLVEYNDESGEELSREVLKDFKIMHAKFMHLVIVQEDFQDFAHVHPIYNSARGSFHITLNLPSSDPDNEDTVGAIKRDGRYFFFMEAESLSRGMVMARYNLDVGQGTRPGDIPVYEFNEENTIVLYSDKDGKPGEFGSPYELTFSFTNLPGEGGVLHTFTTHIKKYNRFRREYREITTVKPWLMMGSHALLLSHDGERAQEKIYQHMHGPNPVDMAAFDFSPFNRGSLEKGDYTLWTQFKDDTKLITLPVSFHFDPQN